MSLMVTINALKWDIDHIFMLTQLTATPIFQRLAYDEFYCKGLYICQEDMVLVRIASVRTHPRVGGNTMV